MSENGFRFDFDEWMNLARNDPEAFDARRQQMISELINTAPPQLQQRLRGFQWRIDMERSRCDNPMQACIKLSNMMWELVYGDRGFLWSLQQLSDPQSLLSAESAEATSGAAPSAAIVPLRPREPKS